MSKVLIVHTGWYPESIEIMRFLEHGEGIACVPVASGSIGVDTPEDVTRVEKILVDTNETKS